jgi:hypothetical protein
MLALVISGGLVLAASSLSLGAAAPALAFVPVGGGGGSGGGGGGGTGGSGGVVPTACSPGYVSSTNANSDWQDTGKANANDVAAGLDGSVWYVTGTPGNTGTAVRVSPSFESFNLPVDVGKRIAVDPQGNPWIVDFNGHIWHLVNGSFQELSSGLARDIAVAPNGTVWVIGTNSLNGSFQVYSWNGSTWTANPGSGNEIDVAANGDPVVNGSDGKVWIMNGGANSGWSEVDPGGLVPVFDMGLSPCSPAGQADVGGSAMWMATENIPPMKVFSLGALNNSGTPLTGPYATTDLAVSKYLFDLEVTASHVAVDTQGRVWVVADPGGKDVPGELLLRAFN